MYVFYRISISRAHCYVVLTLFSLISAPNDTLQLLAENRQFLSGIRNLWEWRKQDLPYISFLISLEIFHLIFDNMIFFHQDLTNTSPSSLISVNLWEKYSPCEFLSYETCRMCQLFYSSVYNPCLLFFFSMRRSIWEVWCKMKRWQIIWAQTQLWKVTVKRRKESKPHTLTS